MSVVYRTDKVHEVSHFIDQFTATLVPSFTIYYPNHLTHNITTLQPTMAATSSMFLSLTPAMHQVDGGSQVSGPMDAITSNLAVFESVANSLKAAYAGDEGANRESNGGSAEQKQSQPPPADDLPTDSVPIVSSENILDEPILPPPLNSIQDEVASILTTGCLPSPTTHLSPATTLKRRLENTKDLIVCPGVYDGFSARIALSVGFDALYMVGCTHH